MTRRLIVNADDYGLTASVSAGIREAHLNGVVTSTTAMMNVPGVEAELARAASDCPSLGLGVHLNLTQGRPLLTPAELRSLVRLAKGGRLPSQTAIRAGAGKLVTSEIKAEWRAQIARFVSALGRRPTHLDSHHHSSYLTPALFGAMLDLAREFECGVRSPLTGAALRRVHRDLGLSEPAADGHASRLADLLESASGVPHPDQFDSEFYGKGATDEYLCALLERLPAGVTEIMTHPGLRDARLAEVTSYAAERAVELSILTSPRVRAVVSAAEIELIRFSDLRPS